MCQPTTAALQLLGHTTHTSLRRLVVNTICEVESRLCHYEQAGLVLGRPAGRSDLVPARITPTPAPAAGLRQAHGAVAPP
jgi:hypothetical protein